MIRGIGLDPGKYTWHSFRRGGATASYEAGCDYISIKRHGTWASDCFWQYITAAPAAKSQVAAGLARHVVAE